MQKYAEMQTCASKHLRVLCCFSQKITLEDLFLLPIVESSFDGNFDIDSKSQKHNQNTHESLQREINMSKSSIIPDKVIQDIVDYVVDYEVRSEEAMRTARYALMDSIGCALLALQYPHCTKLLGPVVEGTVVPKGVRVPGTKVLSRDIHPLIYYYYYLLYTKILRSIDLLLFPTREQPFDTTHTIAHHLTTIVSSCSTLSLEHSTLVPWSAGLTTMTRGSLQRYDQTSDH